MQDIPSKPGGAGAVSETRTSSVARRDPEAGPFARPSLPKGGGAIRSMGEKFATELVISILP